MTHSRREIQRLLTEIGLHPRKALGQNFVADPNLVRRIARLAEITRDERVIEIGPGLGSLTLALVEAGAIVTAIEIDPLLAAKLRELVDPTRVEVIEADAMRVDWSSIVAPTDRITLVANLPYNIATPLIADLLDDVPGIRRMIVMVQREVARRLVARAGDDDYGIPSVKVAFWADAKIVGTVPRDVFVPRPNVESAIVCIERRDAAVDDVGVDAVFELVRAGFGQRRKMLRRSLAGRATVEQLTAAGIGPEQRAEEIDVARWCRLARIVGAPESAGGETR
jgi:16S rRNA (adenine1518-N6/adenine1519-N6)-dimethyltransferase